MTEHNCSSNNLLCKSFPCWTLRAGLTPCSVYLLDTRLVAQEPVTQTKLNICLTSFYMGWILMEIRFFKGHWGCTTFLKKPFFFYAVRYTCCLRQGELALKEFKCLLEKYYHFLALSLYIHNKYQKENFDTIIFFRLSKLSIYLEKKCWNASDSQPRKFLESW